MNGDKAHQLLDPADKQNVPKAVTLIQTLLQLSTEAKPSTSPSHLHQCKMLTFLAWMSGYFVLPFTSVNYSLAQQIRSLVTYTFVIAAMWMCHGTSFMTGALYANSQAIIRNIIITTLWLQIVDKDIPFHIILEGIDCLERLFSECHTQDHSWNFDILQLCKKLSVSTLISSIFKHNPDLDRGHWWLNLHNVQGVDHVNPASWKGDVVVGNVEVEVEWEQGRRDTIALLKEYFGEEGNVDFSALFADSVRDLLRPGPQGKYIGLQHTEDNDHTERQDDVSTDTPLPGDPDAENTVDAPQSEPSVPDPEEFHDVPPRVGIDEFLPDTIRATNGSANLPEESPLVHNTQHFIQVGDKCFLKSSIVAAFLTSNWGKKVLMQTLRAQGVMLEALCSTDKWNAPDVNSKGVIRSGDTAAALVCISELGTICLAVIEIMKFMRQGDTAWLSSPEVDDLRQSNGSAVTVEVQILQLTESQQTGSDTWHWMKQYVRSGTKRSDNEQATMKQHTLLVPGYLIHLLSAQIAEFANANTVVQAKSTGQTVLNSNDPHILDAPASNSESSRIQTTWSYIASELHDTLEITWEALGSSPEELMASVDLTSS